MAVPSSFAESNGVLSRPDNMTDDQCGPMSVMFAQDKDQIPYVITCWKLTPKELEEVNKTGRIWLGLAGNTMAPAFVSGIKPI